jgi:hypothetical protein
MPSNQAITEFASKLESPTSLQALQFTRIETAIASTRTALPVELRPIARRVAGFWLAEIPQDDIKVVFEWVGSLGKEPSGEWVLRESGLQLLSRLHGKVNVSFDVSSPWVGNVLSFHGKSFLLRNAPQEISECVPLTDRGHGVFSGLIPINFSSDNSPLSETDLRQATAFIANLRVVSGC